MMLMMMMIILILSLMALSGYFSSQQPSKSPNFDSVKATFIARIDEIFADLSSKYAELETQQKDCDYEDDYDELQEMLLRHKEENEEWIQTKKQEIDEKQQELEQEKIKKSTEERAKLTKDQSQEFANRIKNGDAENS
ncbi:hypothetical protein QZH41_005948 [Actinostola sp. cb2023]|nr:hypothetical protein QZH41_005948 [Actinostola sp. cb2023]